MKKAKICSGSGIIVILLCIIVIFLSALSAVAFAQNNPYRSQEFTLNGVGELFVETSGGHITVEGAEGNRVRVEMYVREDGEFLSPTDTDLSDFDIEISKSGNQIRAVADRENGSDWKFWDDDNDISISFVVYTPSEMSTDLHTSGGHIEVSGLNGSQDISTSGGHLTLTRLEGTIDAQTSGGHITLRNITGDIEVQTSGGYIEAENVEGTAGLQTSGGSIELNDIRGTISAETSGGSITADISEVGKFLKLETSGGNISITVPEGIGLDLDLSGSLVRSNLDISSNQWVTNEVETSINGGGPEIYAHTSGGVVQISFE